MSLIAWYPLNGNLNNQGIKNIELSSQGNISLDNNGKFGKCYYFDGVDDILYNNTVDLSEQCSLSVWFNPSRITSTTQWIVRLGAYAMGEVQLGFYINTSGIKFSGLSEKNYNISLSINTWYHLVMTLDRNKIKGYLNGELVVDFDSNISKYSILTIGGRFDGNSTNLNYLFQGKINNIKIYDHCLSQEEVLQDYKQPMLHYSFENPYVEPTMNLCNTFIKDTVYGTTYGTDSIGDYFIKVKSSVDGGWSGGVRIGSNTVYGGNYYTWSLEVNPEVDIPATIGYNFDRNIAPTSTWVGNDAGCEIIDDYKGIIPKNTWTRIWITVYISPEIGKATLQHRCCPAVPSGLDQYKCYYRNSMLEKKRYMSTYTSSNREAGLIRDNSGMGNDGIQVYQREEIPITINPTADSHLSINYNSGLFTITGFNGNDNQCVNLGTIKYNSRYHYLNSKVSYEFDITLKDLVMIDGKTLSDYNTSAFTNTPTQVQGQTYYNDGTNAWTKNEPVRCQIAKRLNDGKTANGTFHICYENTITDSSIVTNINYYEFGIRFNYVKSGTITISNLHAYYQNLDTSTLSITDNSAIGTHSAYFNGKNRINCGLVVPEEMDELTLSCWVYKEDWSTLNPNWSTTGITPSIIGNIDAGGFGLKVEKGNNVVNWVTYYKGKGYGPDNLIDCSGFTSGWHLFTGVSTKTKKSLYVDGKIINSNDITWNAPILSKDTIENIRVNIYIGTEVNGDYFTNLENVYIDDVRLYSTALSDEDIKALYNVKTRIDNKSNLYCNQLVETKSENMMKPMNEINISDEMHKHVSGGTFTCTDGIMKYTISSSTPPSSDPISGFYFSNLTYGGALKDNLAYRTSFYVRVSKAGTYVMGEERIKTITRTLEAGKWYKIVQEGLATGVHANFVIYNYSRNLVAGDTMEVRDVQIYRLYNDENYNPGPNTKGQYKTFELNETLTNNPNAKIVNKYNARWLQVFHHNTNNNTVWFKNAAEALHCNTTYKFSILDQLEYFRNKDGNFEFLLEYPIELPNKYNRWIQSDNPATTTEGDTPNGSPATGYTAVHIDWSNHLWGGLLKGNFSGKFCFMDGDTNHGNWHYAIGCYDNTNNMECIEKWRTKMPGPAEEYPATEVNLYVRIDDNDNFKIYNRNTKANEIIEI